MIKSRYYPVNLLWISKFTNKIFTNVCKESVVKSEVSPYSVLRFLTTINMYYCILKKIADSTQRLKYHLKIIIYQERRLIEIIDNVRIYTISTKIEGFILNSQVCFDNVQKT